MFEEIRPEDIGVVVNSNRNTIDFPTNPLAHTLRSNTTNEMSIRYHDGTERTIKTSFFKKKIDRTPYYVDKSIAPADHYMSMWTLAQSSGLPVAPTAKINDNEVSILDISDGGLFFDKAMAGRIDPNAKFKNVQKLTPEEFKHPSFKRFSEIPMEEIEAEMRRVVAIANAHNLWLPNDDPINLLVLPDGSWRMVVLDPMNLRQYDRTKGEYKSTTLQFSDWTKEHTPDELNEQGVKQYMSYIKTIRENIAQHIEQSV